jgi:hypothetical protein
MLYNEPEEAFIAVLAVALEAERYEDVLQLLPDYVNQHKVLNAKGIDILLEASKGVFRAQKCAWRVLEDKRTKVTQTQSMYQG